MNYDVNIQSIISELREARNSSDNTMSEISEKKDRLGEIHDQIDEATQSIDYSIGYLQDLDRAVEKLNDALSEAEDEGFSTY